MTEFIGLTILTLILVLPYLYSKKKASIQLGFFPGIMIGASFSENEVEVEEEMVRIGALQFSLISIMITIIWKI